MNKVKKNVFKKVITFKSCNYGTAGPWKGPWASLTPIPATGRGMGGAGWGGGGTGPRKPTSPRPPGPQRPVPEDFPLIERISKRIITLLNDEGGLCVCGAIKALFIQSSSPPCISAITRGFKTNNRDDIKRPLFIFSCQ
jgi:hypothetical protein